MNYNHVILFFVHLLTPTTSHVCEDTVGQIFRPDPDDCSKYYLCTPQRAWTLNCPHGTAWNQISSKCEDKAWNVLCNKQGDKPKSTNLKPFLLNDETKLGYRTSGITTVMDRWSSKYFCPFKAYQRHAHPTRCAQYYDCSETSDLDWWGSNLRECPPNEVFDNNTKQCSPASSTDCGGRELPKDSCDYLKNQCRSSHCVPCHIRHATCKGLPDGIHHWRGRELSPYFIDCKNDKLNFFGQCQTAGAHESVMYDNYAKSCVKKTQAVMKQVIIRMYRDGTNNNQPSTTTPPSTTTTDQISYNSQQNHSTFTFERFNSHNDTNILVERELNGTTQWEQNLHHSRIFGRFRGQKDTKISTDRRSNSNTQWNQNLQHSHTINGFQGQTNLNMFKQKPRIAIPQQGRNQLRSGTFGGFHGQTETIRFNERHMIANTKGEQNQLHPSTFGQFHVQKDAKMQTLRLLNGGKHQQDNQNHRSTIGRFSGPKILIDQQMNQEAMQTKNQQHSGTFMAHRDEQILIGQFRNTNANSESNQRRMINIGRPHGQNDARMLIGHVINVNSQQKRNQHDMMTLGQPIGHKGPYMIHEQPINLDTQMIPKQHHTKEKPATISPEKTAPDVTNEVKKTNFVLRLPNINIISKSSRSNRLLNLGSLKVNSNDGANRSGTQNVTSEQVKFTTSNEHKQPNSNTVDQLISKITLKITPVSRNHDENFGGRKFRSDARLVIVPVKKNDAFKMANAPKIMISTGEKRSHNNNKSHVLLPVTSFRESNKILKPSLPEQIRIIPDKMTQGPILSRNEQATQVPNVESAAINVDQKLPMQHINAFNGFHMFQTTQGPILVQNSQKNSNLPINKEMQNANKDSPVYNHVRMHHATPSPVLYQRNVQTTQNQNPPINELLPNTKDVKNSQMKHHYAFNHIPMFPVTQNPTVYTQTTQDSILSRNVQAVKPQILPLNDKMPVMNDYVKSPTNYSNVYNFYKGDNSRDFSNNTSLVQDNQNFMNQTVHKTNQPVSLIVSIPNKGGDKISIGNDSSSAQTMEMATKPSMDISLVESIKQVAATITSVKNSDVGTWGGQSNITETVGVRQPNSSPQTMNELVDQSFGYLLQRLNYLKASRGRRIRRKTVVTPVP